MTDRQTNRDRQRETETGRLTDRQTDRERQSQRQRDTERQIETDRQTEDGGAALTFRQGHVGGQRALDGQQQDEDGDHDDLQGPDPHSPVPSRAKEPHPAALSRFTSSSHHLHMPDPPRPSSVCQSDAASHSPPTQSRRPGGRRGCAKPPQRPPPATRRLQR